MGSSPPPPPPVVPRSDPDTGGENRPAFRFSLRTLMLGVTAVAVLMGCAVVLPATALVAFFQLCALATTAAATTVVIHGSGDFRTFCLGALFPLAVSVVQFTLSGPRSNFASTSTFMPSGLGNSFAGFAAVADALGLAVAVVVVGSICVWVRRKIDRKPGV